MTIQKKDQFNRNESPTFYSCPGELNQCRAATSYLVKPPIWATFLYCITKYCSEDLFGGPRLWRLSTVINMQKCMTVPLFVFFMWHYGRPTHPAFTFLVLHGSYGIVWLLKHFVFPDPRFNVPITTGGSIASFILVLAPYWIGGWLLMSHRVVPRYPLPDHIWLAGNVLLCSAGSIIMIAADAQEYFTNRIKCGLITDGLYRYIRHPNYLGQFMIYSSFILVSWNWIPTLVYSLIWGVSFGVYMIIKDASLSCHPEWKSYRDRTCWLIPKVL